MRRDPINNLENHDVGHENSRTKTLRLTDHEFLQRLTPDGKTPRRRRRRTAEAVMFGAFRDARSKRRGCARSVGFRVGNYSPRLHSTSAVGAERAHPLGMRPLDVSRCTRSAHTRSGNRTRATGSGPTCCETTNILAVDAIGHRFRLCERSVAWRPMVGAALHLFLFTNPKDFDLFCPRRTYFCNPVLVRACTNSLKLGKYRHDKLNYM